MCDQTKAVAEKEYEKGINEAYPSDMPSSTLHDTITYQTAKIEYSLDSKIKRQLSYLRARRQEIVEGIRELEELEKALSILPENLRIQIGSFINF